jgi:hypothetical protein
MLRTFVDEQLNSWRALRTEKLINKVTHLLIHYLFLLISLADLRPSLFAVLANDLRAAQKSLWDEKFARLGVENSLAEEKASRQAAEQSLQQSKDVNATLALELKKPRPLLLLLVTNWIVSEKP